MRHFARIHALGVMSVRNVLDRPDGDNKTATIERRVGDAGLVLDELIAMCEQSTLPFGIAPLLERCEARKDALEAELRALAQGLDAEMEATEVLEGVLKGTRGTSKEAFMHLCHRDDVGEDTAREAAEILCLILGERKQWVNNRAAGDGLGDEGGRFAATLQRERLGGRQSGAGNE